MKKAVQVELKQKLPNPQLPNTGPLSEHDAPTGSVLTHVQLAGLQYDAVGQSTVSPHVPPRPTRAVHMLFPHVLL